MRQPLLFLPLLLLPFFSFSQTKWANYVNDHIIFAIATEGDQVWVGTQGGLLRFDRQTGARQVYLPANSGIRGLGVQSLAIAPDGTKWVGGESGGLFRFDGENWQQFYHVNTGDTLIQIRKLAVAPNGDVWLHSTVNANCGGCSKFFRYDGNQFTRMDSLFGPLSGFGGTGTVQDFDVAEDGDLWVVANGKLHHFENDSVVGTWEASNAPLLLNESFAEVVAKDDQHVLLTTSRYELQVGSSFFRILRFDGNQWSASGVTNATEDKGWCNRLFEDGQGNAWVYFQEYVANSHATYARTSFDDPAWQTWTDGGLDIVTPGYIGPDLMHVSPDGHWWMAQYGGGMHAQKLMEYDGASFKKYETEIFPLLDNYPSDVAFDCDGNTWFGAGGLNRFDGTNWQDFTNAEIGFPVNPWSLNYDSANCKLWIASYGLPSGESRGIASYDGNVFTPHESNGFAFDVEFAPDGTTWAGTGSGLGKFDGTNWTWFDETNSPVQGYVYDIAPDASGGVWAATYSNGLCHWDGSQWQVFNSSNSPVSDYAYLCFVDHAGFVWTQVQQGLLRFDGVNWQLFPEFLGDYGISAIAQDALHHYWIGNSLGLLHWDGGSNIIQYDVNNSAIGGNYVRQIRIDKFGNKWLVHSTGVSVFNENGISSTLVNPPNSVRGKVFFDANQDGQAAASGEPGLPGEPLLLLPDSVTTFSTFGGDFSFYPTPGDYQIVFQAENPFVPTTPATLDLLMGNESQTGFHFGAWSAQPPDSITVDATVGMTRCNQTTNVWVSVTNLGLFDAAGEIQLTFDPAFSFISAEPPPQDVQGNVVTWTYEGLAPFEYDPVKIFLQTPGVDAVGDSLALYLAATRVENGQVVRTAFDRVWAVVRCSYDPNDKLAEPTGVSQGDLSLLGDALDFTIRFQNLGNDTAFTVIVRDTLDSNLDPATLQVLAASHPVRTTLESGNVLTFFFENIHLLWAAFDEPGSQGFVKYRISPRPGLPDNSLVENVAHIYFDFNPAIVTNTTANVLVESLALAANEPKNEAEIVIYPNPNAGDFSVEWQTEGGWQLTLMDLSGRWVERLDFAGRRGMVRNLEPGFYLAILNRGGETVCRKVVVLE